MQRCRRRSFLQHGQQVILRQDTTPNEVEPIRYFQVNAPVYAVAGLVVMTSGLDKLVFEVVSI